MNGIITTQTNTQYKRTSKYPSDETKMKISQSLKGRSKPDSVRSAISSGMKSYWNTPSNFPDDANGERHEGTGRGWIETGEVI